MDLKLLRLVVPRKCVVRPIVAVVYQLQEYLNDHGHHGHGMHTHGPMPHGITPLVLHMPTDLKLLRLAGPRKCVVQQLPVVVQEHLSAHGLH